MSFRSSFLRQRQAGAAAALALLLAWQAPLQAQGLRLPGSQGGGSSLGAGSGYGQDLRDAASNAAASAAPGTRQADFIVALVNSEPITNNEVENRLEQARNFFAQQGQHPGEAVLRQEVLNLLIAERLQLQEAKETRTTVDDYTLDQAEQNVAAQNGVSVSAMHQELASHGISRDQFRRQLRNQLTLMRIRERAVESRVQISDQELDQYLREHPVDLGQQVPEAVNLGHVLVIVPESASGQQEAALRQKIDTAAQQLADGRDFAAVAREFSDAAEGATGGELGLRPVTQYPELFLEATAGQSVGTVVGPIRSGAGFHLLKVLERQEGGSGMVVQNHARHILITPGSGRSEREIAQMLAEIRQRVVQGGEDFALLAREYSEDPGSATKGGDLGWVGPGMFVPEFQAVLDELQPGEVSQPVVSRFGLHLIQLLERRQSRLTQQDQRASVREQAREAKVETEFAKWIEQLRARAYIEIRDPEND
ncbi:molecular chaperone SurA [Corticibacter populi]|uniref:Chaperone SurA n=1 Tax=Corticibacter populi TaxID=1550736 RepID=A0A3M6QVR5_9BURK|nr:peptidylprolyl isomerase [Corticibacter populi]RMX06669.1 molecular chaperone SurA [Corticibacter populi]RZS31756.1 periplasmic chaperone for outer membrane proteins SurA [Corticibacter populi]